MWRRYACPYCQGDLKAKPPKPGETPWYKLVSRYILRCPFCGAKLLKRFAGLDAGLLCVLTTGGAASIWGAGKFLLPLAAVLIGSRLVAGRFLSVYVPAKERI